MSGALDLPERFRRNSKAAVVKLSSFPSSSKPINLKGC